MYKSYKWKFKIGIIYLNNEFFKKHRICWNIETYKFILHNAVNRKTESGRILGENHKIPVKEAIKAVTINGAYQYFEEDIKGSIEPGKRADLVIIDKDVLSIDKEEIENIKVLETIKDGNTIFKL